MEIAAGWLPGYGEIPDPDPSPSHPVEVLRDIIRAALQSTPCVVAFSGGRDSSVILALAAEIARREQLAPPVAMTFRHDGDDDADESGFQEAVVGHLARSGLPVEWQRVVIGDEFDLIGPLMRPVLLAHGAPVWPASLGPTIELARRAAGGAVLTGEFGDEITGPQRMTVLRGVVRRRGRGLALRDWSNVAAEATPRLLSGWHEPRGTVDLDWLTPDARAESRRRTRADVRRLPLRWDRSVRTWMARRAAAVGHRTTDLTARAHGCLLVQPLGEPAFVDAFAAFGGAFGLRSRSSAVELLSAGLLPAEVVRRRSKAVFNTSRFGPLTQEFVATWDGSGVDRALVDVDVLRRRWRAREFHAQSALLLQQAWLAGTRKEVA
ncbi:asparagine synthase-related protein [Pseudonocardia tropica]|uniref:Asparagine synthase-related protein n=1 Tax=Pseudonocardia tropica TaxID=681289 RepID=A0ABV1JYJ5_9PSEU